MGALRSADRAVIGSEPVWRAVEGRRLHWREWGDSSVVYDDISGETKQFSPLAAAAMACLEEQPHSTASLATALADILGCCADGELYQSVTDAIEQFRELDWIEPLTRA